MKQAILAIAFGALVTSTGTQAAGVHTGAFGVEGLKTNNIVAVHSKRCKFYHPDGYTYKGHCPHDFKKGSRKKRAGIGAGIGAATGALIGGIVGGGKAAAIGAGAGAAAGAIGGAASLNKCWYRDRHGRKVKVKCRQ